MKKTHIILLALLMAVAAQAENANSNRNADRTNITEQEDLAISALEGLMAQPPERALPILKKVLAGTQSNVVKRRALFVLSQIEGPEANAILMQTARSSNLDLRGDAIRSIGIGGDPKSLDALMDIYKTADAGLKKDIMQSWMIAGRKEAIYQAALNAKTDDEASDAIHMLGAMGATEELRKLGDKPTLPKGLIDAYAISGDLASLRKFAESGADKNARVEAIRHIGIISGDESRVALRDIYAKATDAQIKDAALQGMLISQDEKGVLALYRAAKTTEEKRSLLRMLSMMDGDAALEAIDAAVGNK